MSYSLILFVFLALLFVSLPGIVVVAVPAKAARAAVGWVTFAIGLFFIDFWTAGVLPYDDDGVGPDPSILILFAWGVTLSIGIAARSEVLLFGSDAEPPPHPALSWSIPLSALASTVFLHWLRNRLAGTEPAEWVHGAVMAAFVVIVLVAGWALSRHAHRFTAPLWAILAFGVTGLILVSANIAMGFWMWQHAREFAADKPYCVMTYGGFETKSVARGGWELSPLVDRSYGVWAVRKTPFLVVGEKVGTKSYIYFNREWRDVTFSAPHRQP